MASSSPPCKYTTKGWLLKWTNYVKGYKRRWFVLSKGMLSYYRNEEEMAHTCRGTINITGALIHTYDTCSFIVSSRASQVFHLKASNEVERQRWVTALEISKLCAITANELKEEIGLPVKERREYEIFTIIKNLGNRIENLQTCYNLIIKHGNALKTILSEFENIEKPEDITNEIKNINKQATLFRITCNAMINNCMEYLELVRTEHYKLQNVLEEEQNQRKQLEEYVERLITQYSLVEKSAKDKRLLSNSEIKLIVVPDLTPSVADEENIFFFDAIDNTVITEVQAKESTEIFGSVDLPPQVLEKETIEIVSPDMDSVSIRSRICPGTSQDRRSLILNTLNEQSQRRPLKRRSRIPDRPQGSVNLWSIMKNCIGKDLSKIPMPVNFSEPLSMLQRIAEDFEYSSILDHAASREDVCEQLAYIAAFTISNYSTTALRSAKPFNPLLGETFELDRTDDYGWRLITEQVSHHPPMAAQHCEAKEWTFWQEFTMSSKFRGKYLQIIPLGIAHLLIHKNGNHYTWRKVTTTVNNIIIGKLWVDQQGEMDIVNHTDGSKCHLTYLPFSYFKSDNQRKVKGSVYDKDGKVKWIVEGTWDKEVKIAPVLNVKGTKDNPVYDTGNYTTAWKCTDLPPNSEKYYNFSLFACQLNEMEYGVAPTDSRRRPDQRLMEEGNWDEANLLKVTLEEKQRAARKAREKDATDANISSKTEEKKQVIKEKDNNQCENETQNKKDSLEEEIDNIYTPYEPLWFKKEVDSITGKIIHVYNGGYWEAKEKQDWSMCPDIYL